MNTVTSTRIGTQFRTALLLAGLTGFALVVAWMFGGTGALIIAAVFAVGFNLAMYWWSDKLALKMSRAQPLDENADPELFAMVASLARRASVPMPRLYVIPQEQPNAFATGRNPEHAAIAVTVGLRKYLPANQLEGVLAHEFAHIKNRDILITSMAAMIAGVISGIANILQFSLFCGGDDEDSGPLGFIGLIATIILAPLAAMLIQMGISRQREYLADAVGAQILGDPDPLADALATLERGAEALPMQHVNPAAEPLYIVNPLRGGGISGLFATHPPIAERIRRLRALTV